MLTYLFQGRQFRLTDVGGRVGHRRLTHSVAIPDTGLNAAGRRATADNDRLKPGGTAYGEGSPAEPV
jgi:hypothetical protein